MQHLCRIRQDLCSTGEDASLRNGLVVGYFENMFLFLLNYRIVRPSTADGPPVGYFRPASPGAGLVDVSPGGQGQVYLL